MESNLFRPSTKEETIQDLIEDVREDRIRSIADRLATTRNTEQFLKDTDIERERITAVFSALKKYFAYGLNGWEEK